MSETWSVELWNFSYKCFSTLWEEWPIDFSDRLDGKQVITGLWLDTIDQEKLTFVHAYVPRNLCG